MDKKKVSKLFNVLVVGGTMMAAGAAAVAHAGPNGKAGPAFDTDAAHACISPQCNCWLG